PIRTGTSIRRIAKSADGSFEIFAGRKGSGGSAEYNSKNTPPSFRADYVLLATGGTRQGYELATYLGHTIVDPVPSLFTFKISDNELTALAGVSFPKVVATLELEGKRRPGAHLTQEGPLLITHWGLSGPAILRLSAWAARDLFQTNYTGTLLVDFVPQQKATEVCAILGTQKQAAQKRKIGGSPPVDLNIPRRFWLYIISHKGLNPDDTWGSIPASRLQEIGHLLKRWPFPVSGKGVFKEEFVTAGGIPLVEIDLQSMESRKCPNLYFAGEVLDIDGVTGGFNFQNAWTGGFLAGTSIAKAVAVMLADGEN
ncbi:hypothetical protein CBR_g50657, partial [Chara braunii]